MEYQAPSQAIVLTSCVNTSLVVSRPAPPFGIGIAKKTTPLSCHSWHILVAHAVICATASTRSHGGEGGIYSIGGYKVYREERGRAYRYLTQAFKFPDHVEHVSSLTCHDMTPRKGCHIYPYLYRWRRYRVLFTIRSIFGQATIMLCASNL